MPKSVLHKSAVRKSKGRKSRGRKTKVNNNNNSVSRKRKSSRKKRKSSKKRTSSRKKRKTVRNVMRGGNDDEMSFLFNQNNQYLLECLTSKSSGSSKKFIREENNNLKFFQALVEQESPENQHTINTIPDLEQKVDKYCDLSTETDELYANFLPPTASASASASATSAASDTSRPSSLDIHKMFTDTLNSDETNIKEIILRYEFGDNTKLPILYYPPNNKPLETIKQYVITDDTQIVDGKKLYKLGYELEDKTEQTIFINGKGEVYLNGEKSDGKIDLKTKDKNDYLNRYSSQPYAIPNYLH